MAKISPGPMAGAISGAMGGTVFSHNRYGAYIRTRAIPVNPDTEWQAQMKGILTQLTRSWSGLTDAGRAAWRTWTLSNPVTDGLGQKQVLTGHVAYIGINSRLLRAGDTVITVPPIAAAPTPLLTVTLTADIGLGGVTVAYTATPLGAGEKLWVVAALVDSVGVNYVRNLNKLVFISAAAAASPADIEAAVEERFGTMQVGEKLIVYASVFGSTTGLLSGPLRDDAVVVTT